MKIQTPNCLACDVKDCSLLRYCSPSWISMIDKSKIYMQARQGQQIILEGTPATGIYFIHSGKVKIHRNGINGKNFILKLGKKGDMFGHCGLDREYKYSSSVTAIEDTCCCFIESAVFNDLLKENPGITYELMLCYASELHVYESRMLRLAQMSVREKVAEAILFLRDTFGEDYDDKAIRALLSRQELADLAGTTKEQVSKVLSEFGQDKIVHLKGKHIHILQPKQLTAIAGF